MDIFVSVRDEYDDEDDDDDYYETDEEKLEELFDSVSSLRSALIDIYERLKKLEHGSKS